MTATLDGTPWIPVMTRASARDDGVISLLASDCKSILQIFIWRFRGLGTYDVAAGDILVDNYCEDSSCCWRSTRADHLCPASTDHCATTFRCTRRPPS